MSEQKLFVNKEIFTSLENAKENWYPVAPLGNHPHTYGLQVFGVDQANSIINFAKSKGPDWTGYPVYIGHPEGDAPAVSWTKEFKLENEVLYCLIEETPNFVTQIKINKEFKCISPAWLCISDDSGNYFPVEMDHLGLTNKPNIKSTKPWVNSELENKILDNANEWWEKFMNKLNEFIPNENDPEKISKIISNKLDEVFDKSLKYEKVKELTNSINEDEIIVIKSFIDDNKVLKDELEKQNKINAELTVDLYIQKNKINPVNREKEILRVMENRQEVISEYEKKDLIVPENPLKNGLMKINLNSKRNPTKEEIEEIQKKTREIMEKDKMSYSDAHAKSWAMFYK